MAKIKKESVSSIGFLVTTKLKNSFEKVVGKKYMSYILRKEMQRIVDESNKINHA